MTDETPPVEPAPMHKAWVGIGEAIHAKVQHKVTQARTEATAGMLEQIEADLVPLVRPIARKMLDHPDTPAELRPALEVLAGPEHFSGSIVISFAVGALLSPVLGAALQPIVQQLENVAWQTAIGTDPTAGGRPVSPDLLAAAVLKGVLTEDAAKGLATLSGFDNTNFHTMVETAGQSIGLQEALLLYRRKQIPLSNTDPNNPGLLQVLQYSNVNPRFYAAAELLQYVPLSTGEVVTANLKGHLDDATAVAMLQEAGIDGAKAATGTLNVQQLLKASAGRPPGTQEMLHLWNLQESGVLATGVTEAVVDAAVKQSDINDAFLPYVKELRHYFPPPRSVVPMLRAGAITEAEARQLLTAYGVGEPWATAFVTEAKHTKSGAVKDLSQAQIVGMYEARLMPAATALTRLEAVGYSAADAQMLLDLADEKRTVALQNAAMRKIGAEYVGYKITLAEATSAMAQAAIPTAAQHDAVTYWDVEKSVNIHKPTPPQIMGAFRRGDIDGAEAHSRLLASGVLASDMHIFAADAFPPTKPNAKGVAIVVSGAALYVDGTSQPPATGTKAETLTQITGLYVQRIIDKPTAVAKIEALGYTAADANDLIALAGPQIPLPTTGAKP